MAVTKKKAPKIKKAKVPKQETQRRVAPPVPKGLVSISLSPSELSTLASLMSICAQEFEGQALAAAEGKDETKYAQAAARHKLSFMFATRFVEFCKMPEPESWDLH